jgi:hypothetical protein
VNGVKWNQFFHGQTGCMSQFQVNPQANNSPLNIGTMAKDSWFQGAIGKVAIYNYLLTKTRARRRRRCYLGKSHPGVVPRVYRASEDISEIPGRPHHIPPLGGV